ncbi:MAG: hypothetical protein Q9191_007027 [Dirinaria sp. TL-2023a]
MSASSGSSDESVSQSSTLQPLRFRQDRYAAELSSSPSPRDLPNLELPSELSPASLSEGDSSSILASEASNQSTSAQQQDTLHSDPDHQLSSSSSRDSEQIPNSTIASAFLARIAPERELAASLDTLTSCDLSIHLFNAFALKRRVGARFKNPRRTPEFGDQRSKNSSKNVRSRAEPSSAVDDNEITYEQVGDYGWHPPRVWTSWPMQVEEVPREWARSEWDDESPLRGAANHGIERSSEILQDCLNARILNAAKVRFRGREWATQERKADSRSSERMERERLRVSSAWHRGRPQTSVNIVGGSEEEVEYKPVEAADDDAASKILRPSVQHLVAKLDELLLGLYRARVSYATVRSKRSFGDVDEEIETGSEPVASSVKPSRKRRRPTQESTKNPQAQNLQGKDFGADEPATDYSVNTRSRKRQRTASASRPSSRHVGSKSRATSRSSSQASTKFARPSYKATFASLDWSTVLGVAALQGWSSGVIHRAAQRCGDLFDERMRFHVLDGDERRERGADMNILPANSSDSHEAKVKGRDRNDDEEDASEHGSTEDESSSKLGQTRDGEAMCGGVHVDGFLQPVQGKRWWGKVVERRDASLPKGPKGRPRKYDVDKPRSRGPMGRPRKKKD